MTSKKHPWDQSPPGPNPGDHVTEKDCFKLSASFLKTCSPLIVSCPHVGTDLPEAIRQELDPTILETLPDTDWYVDQLYAFSPSLGATLLAARWSRYVIDLNRDPHDRPLYQDGRPETGLIPTHSFGGVPLGRAQKQHHQEISPKDREERLKTYYRPYHEKIRSLIAQLRQKHSHVLLWEAHSIKRFGGKNQKIPFVDIMLGDRDGTSCDPAITEAALGSLSTTYTTVLNTPFKGGYLTKHFANPQKGIHTLQVEMCQDLYLKDADPENPGFPTLSQKAPILSEALKGAMIEVLKILNDKNTKT